MLGWQADATRHLLSPGQRLLEPNRGSRRIAPGDEGAARWRAHRRCRVCAGEAYPLRCQPVEVRRPVIGAPIATEVAIAEIVGKDEQHVWERLPAGPGARPPPENGSGDSST